MYVRQVLEAVSSPGPGPETVMESAQALLFDALPWLTYTAVCFTSTDESQLVLGASSSRAGPRDAREPGRSFKSGPVIVGCPPGGTLTARRPCSLMTPKYKANHSLRLMVLRKLPTLNSKNVGFVTGHLLQSLFRCGHCGGGLESENARGHSWVGVPTHFPVPPTEAEEHGAHPLFHLVAGGTQSAGIWLERGPCAYSRSNAGIVDLQGAARKPHSAFCLYRKRKACLEALRA